CPRASTRCRGGWGSSSAAKAEVPRRPWGSTLVLELRHVTRQFGGLVAVSYLSMTVARGTIHGLIGPNGAGKSTVFNLISGILPTSSGLVLFIGATVSGLAT